MLKDLVPLFGPITRAKPLVLEAVQQALAQAKPEIWNSDQGSHFTSPQYTGLLPAANVQISMDGHGRALEYRIPAEMYFG